MSLIERFKSWVPAGFRRAAWIASAVVLAVGRSAIAQEAGRTVTVTYYWVDSILVVVLFGAAIFAICRSSRRT